MNIANEIEVLSKLNHWDEKLVFMSPYGNYTHAELHRMARCIANLLSEYNITNGCRVVIGLDDSVHYVALFLACARLGATALLVNPYLPPKNHEDIVNELKPNLAVVRENIANHYHGIILLTEESLLDAVNCGQQLSFFEPSPTAPLYVQFTSGTTGKQKAVPHKHQDFLIYRDAVAFSMLNIRENDILFSLSKLFFAYGFGNNLVFPLMTGCAALLTQHRPSAYEINDLIFQFGVTCMFWVPSGYAAWLKYRDNKHLNTLRCLISAGEALQPSLRDQITQRLGVTLLNQLGSTEVGHAYCGTRGNYNPDNSLGYPLPNYELSVRNFQGEELFDGNEGELWIKGPTIPQNYLNCKDKNLKDLQNGWFKSGDLVIRQNDGSFQYIGRVDDMEMVGGIKISPLAIENVLRQHEEVIDVGVTTSIIENQSRLNAYVVSTMHTQVLAEELRQLASTQLAPYMVPKQIIFVDSLPRTTSGKLQRHIIRSADWTEKRHSVSAFNLMI
ncbi:AMP-binding protein [Photorhabdus luminescens]|uniref:Acyl-CoA synthase n=1 Tax=Photorhabdus luminescens subsp. mexicana TaxID=2100167 RepID=A0A4R4IXB4_PHOLU|nr:AMP-binding protein [Photorhabdus luminescens]TDB45604.1 acyl-CoA synthase [Photorhabdus luminescens subsp. mexicana]